MNISELRPKENHLLELVSEDGRVGFFDVSPYLEYEAFRALNDPAEFMKVSNGGSFLWNWMLNGIAGLIYLLTPF